MHKRTRHSLYHLFCVVFSMVLVENLEARTGADPFMSMGKDLLNPKTGLSIQNKAGKKKQNLPANPEQLPATGTNWSLEVEYCALYIENDIQRFSQLLQQKGAKEEDVSYALKTLAASLYPKKLRTGEGWATDGWIYVQECRSDALKARKALRDYWKTWTPEKAIKEEVEVQESSVKEGDPNQEKKIQKLKQKLALIRQAICEAFDPVIEAADSQEESPQEDPTKAEEDFSVAGNEEETEPEPAPLKKEEVVQKPSLVVAPRPQTPIRQRVVRPALVAKPLTQKPVAAAPVVGRSRVRTPLPPRKPLMIQDKPASSVVPSGRTGAPRKRSVVDRKALKEALANHKDDSFQDFDDEGLGNV
jgi:hypothetical protein